VSRANNGVAWSVGQSVTIVSPATTAESFGGVDSGAFKELGITLGPDSPWEWAICGGEWRPIVNC